MLVLLIHEPRQSYIVIAAGWLGSNKAQRDCSAMGRTYLPVPLDEEEVVAEFLAMDPVPDVTGLADRDPHATVPSMYDVCASHCDVLDRNPALEERLVSIVQ
jgi:hypothetical protein